MSRAYPAMLRLIEIWETAIADSVYADNLDVYLGPLYSGDPDDAVFVGYDGDPGGEFEMVTHVQNWAALGQRAQHDHFDVHCCILAMAGVSDGKAMSDAMARLYGIWRTLTVALKADPSMGMGPGTAENAPVWVTDVRSFTSYVPIDPDRGVMPRISFDVHVETRV
jgi:hypothetical protein